MLEKLLSSKLLISLVLGLLLTGIIYLEQEFINKNETNRFDLFTYLKAGFVGFTISLVSLLLYKPLTDKSSGLRPIEKILTGKPPF